MNNNKTTRKSRLQRYLLPSLTGRGWGLGLLLLLALQASAYTVTTVDQAPQWQVDWSGNEARPDWTDPDESIYENWTMMLVKIEEALLPYVSANDMLAMFVGDELRGLSKPAIVFGTGEVDATQYVLKIYGNENMGDEVTLTMKYYNAQLKQLFSISENIKLDDNLLIGFDQPFTPIFTSGTTKYPVTTGINVASILAGAGLTPAKGDMVAAFVGDECRGVDEWPLEEMLTVYQKEEGETVVLKYYDAAGKRILTFDNTAEGIIPGDATGDGIVDISDYIAVANYIQGNIPAGFNKEAADVNNDGIIDVSDYIGVANIILYGNARGK